MNILTIDFETYYARDFSLTKVTTEEYVRDDRFEVIGVAVKENDGKAIWYSGSHEFISICLSKYDWANSFALAHIAMFDSAILTWRFGIKPMAWLDTLCMARATDGLEVVNSLAKLVERYNLGAKGTEVLDALGKNRSDFSADELDAYGKKTEQTEQAIKKKEELRKTEQTLSKAIEKEGNLKILPIA